MIVVELSNYEALVARNEIEARLEVTEAGLKDCPGSMRPMYEGHIKAMRDAMAKLDAELIKQGITP